MWRPCNTVLDKPAKLWVFEMQDLGCFWAVALASAVVLELLESVCLAAAVTYGLYRLRRGKPPGYLLHTAHRWGLLRLPGVLSRHPTRYKVF